MRKRDIKIGMVYVDKEINNIYRVVSKFGESKVWPREYPRDMRHCDVEVIREKNLGYDRKGQIIAGCIQDFYAPLISDRELTKEEKKYALKLTLHEN